MSSDLSPNDGDSTAGPLPLGQRLFDNWLLLMILGIVIMGVIYTGWGLWEVSSMPTAELP